MKACILKMKTLCGAGKTDCCCRRLLFTQPDFENQKSHLEEYITSWGHVCDFYPKYHCELNYIKQYWGAAKLIYRSSTKTRDMKEMEENVKIPLTTCLLFKSNGELLLLRFGRATDLIIISYANCATQFISAYGQGLSGPEVAWAK